jgi:hypothetical protein
MCVWIERVGLVLVGARKDIMMALLGSEILFMVGYMLESWLFFG